MNYREQLLKHLATYKTEELSVQEHGIWRRNGKRYAHILPEELGKLNILEGIRQSFWDDPKIGAHGKLQGDFHHLNSSQAMCFNFFYPFLGGVGSRAAVLLGLLGYSGGTVVFVILH